MKILHIICATLMAVAFASCDEHRDFPDTAIGVLFWDLTSSNLTTLPSVQRISQVFIAVSGKSRCSSHEANATAMRVAQMICSIFIVAISLKWVS